METTVRLETNTVRLLDAWKALKGIDSDYKAAKALGITTPTTTNWRHGRNHAETRLAARMAKDLGLDPTGVAAAIEADRAINPEVKRIWEDAAIRLVGRAGFEPATSGLKARSARRGKRKVRKQLGDWLPGIAPRWQRGRSLRERVENPCTARG